MTLALFDGQDSLDHIGVGAVRDIGLGRHQGRYVAGGLAVQQGRASRGQAGVGEGHVALKIDDGVVLPLGIDGLDRRADAVRARRQAGVGQHRPAPDGLDGVDDFLVPRRYRDRLARLQRPLIGPHDHRLAANVGQGLVGQAGGGHAGGDEDEGIHAGLSQLGVTATLGPPAFERKRLPAGCEPRHAVSETPDARNSPVCTSRKRCAVGPRDGMRRRDERRSEVE